MRRAEALGLAIAAAGGCEQVSRLPTGAGRELPREVWAVLEDSCNLDAACHAAGSINGVFDREGTFIGDERGTVVEGDLEASRMYIQIEAGTMPKQPGVLAESGRFTLYGWIASGAELVEPEGATDSGSSGSSGSDETAIPEYDEFAPVLAIIQANCAGDPLCHRDGAVTSNPQLADAIAHDSLVTGIGITGEPYVAPGDADASWVIVRLTAAMGQTIMPQAPNPPLDAEQIDVFRTWIDAGAEL